MAVEFDRLLSVWWLPENPEVKFDGQVSRYADGAAAIELFGSLSGDPMLMDDHEPPVIHGLGKQGPLFTARHVMRSGASMGFPGFTTERLHPRSLVVGAHVDDTTLYDQAVVKTSFLREWLQLTGIRPNFKESTEQVKGSVGVSYEWPPVRTAQVAPGVTVFTWSGHSGNPMRSSYAINEEVALKIELDDPVPLEDLIQHYVRPLVDLVSLGTRRSNVIEGLTVRTPSLVDTVGNEEQRRDLEYLTEWTAQRTQQDPPSLHDMNFALGDAPMGFERLLQGWFKIQAELRPCLAPYFGLVYAPPTYVDLRLVSISQALEGYQRVLGSHQAMPKDEFEAFRDALLAACPPERVDFLKQKLGYLNQLSQVERTEQLVARVAVALRRLFANRPNFAVQFIRARDAKTHPERNAEPGGLQMSELTRVATYLFEASIMLDLGFDESQCAALFERQQEYLYLADRHPSTEN